MLNFPVCLRARRTNVSENAEKGYSVITIKTTVRSSTDRAMPLSALTALGAQASGPMSLLINFSHRPF